MKNLFLMIFLFSIAGAAGAQLSGGPTAGSSGGLNGSGGLSSSGGLSNSGGLTGDIRSSTSSSVGSNTGDLGNNGAGGSGGSSINNGGLYGRPVGGGTPAVPNSGILITPGTPGSTSTSPIPGINGWSVR